MKHIYFYDNGNSTHIVVDTWAQQLFYEHYELLVYEHNVRDPFLREFFVKIHWNNFLSVLTVQ